MPQPVSTLVKALNVLDALGTSAPIGVLELARQLDMDKSAVSRILATFKLRDYVRVNENGQHDLGLRLFELGQAMQDRMPFRDTVIPHVDAIAQETGETSFAVHYSQGQIAYLYDCVSSHDIRLGERAGTRALPWNNLAGKVILAHRDIDTVLADLDTARSTQPERLPNDEDLRKQLARYRRLGYAEQRDADMTLVAVPVMKTTEPVSAAIMVGGPSSRIKPRKVKQLAKKIAQHTEQISRKHGWIS